MEISSGIANVWFYLFFYFILNNSAIPLPGAYPIDRLIPMHNDTVQDYHCSLVPSNKRTQPKAQGAGWLLPTVHTHIRIVHSQKDNVGYLGGKIQSFHCLYCLRFL